MKRFSKKKRKAIVCIHGFGKRGPKEFDILRPFLEKNGYKVYIPQLFSLKNDQDTIWENWLHKAEACINQIQSDSIQIDLLLQHITGCPGNIRYNCAVRSDKQIK